MLGAGCFQIGERLVDKCGQPPLSHVFNAEVCAASHLEPCFGTKEWNIRNNFRISSRVLNISDEGAELHAASIIFVTQVGFQQRSLFLCLCLCLTDSHRIHQR